MFCTPHWAHLRAAVVNAGLSAFMCDTRADLVSKAHDQARHGMTLSNFDAPGAVFSSFTEAAFREIGLTIGLPGPDGTFICPVCDLDRCFRPRYAHRGIDLLDEQVDLVRARFARFLADR